jgi:uncharacterized protein YjiS (DUF1127 family)
MAYVNSRSTTVSISDRFAAFFKAGKEMVERRQLYNRTLNELNALSDRDLMDLGMSRSNISAIAREAAYTK